MKNPNEMSPVHDAVMRHSLVDLKLALRRGSNVDDLDREKRTSLFYAVKDNDIELVKELISNHSNVNAKDIHGESPLHFAARFLSVESAKLLIAAHALVDARDENGNTPLSNATFESRGRGEMIDFLLSVGADRNLKNFHGISPLDLARSIGNFNVIQFFAT